MLFNSAVFIFAFLPLVLAVFWMFGRVGQTRLTVLWLTLASLAFYGWWSPSHLWLLLASILFNYCAARLITSQAAPGLRRASLALGIGGNLACLAYFKYFGFAVRSLESVFGVSLSFADVVLPIGISFYTFTQIAFLVDIYRERWSPYPLLDYALFVTIFPHLVAGPIIHHREMIPQFQRKDIGLFCSEDLAVGATLFTIGLAKKTLLADNAALYATPVFEAAAVGTTLGCAAAWQGVLAYTVQIYFDFSGYSDMAVGIGRMLGIHLPLNFDSPYKATSIMEFWRRWHMTLSRFLRDYLYIPLGGGRAGPRRRYGNLLIVMLLGGLWHGAGWTFVIWGGLHGVYLAINHLWRAHGPKAWKGRLGDHAGRGLTLLAVIIAWVFFRASDVATAGRMLGAMAGLDGFASPLWSLHGSLLVAALLLLALTAPNSQELLADRLPSQIFLRPTPLASRLAWQPTPAAAIIVAALFVASVTSLWRTSEFLYFQF